MDTLQSPKISNGVNPEVSQLNASAFRGQVLRQVYRVWLFRKLLPVLALEVVILSLLLLQLSKAVFIQRVIENGLNVFFLDPPRIISFIVDVFVKAPLLTKILGFGALLLVASVVRHLTQGLLRLFLVKQNYFRKVK